MSEHLDIDLETRISKLENKLKKKSKIIETLLAEILEMKQRIQNLESERVQEEEEDDNENEDEEENEEENEEEGDEDDFYWHCDCKEGEVDEDEEDSASEIPENKQIGLKDHCKHCNAWFCKCETVHRSNVLCCKKCKMQTP